MQVTVYNSNNGVADVSRPVPRLNSFVRAHAGIKFMQGQKLEDMHKYCTASAEAQPIHSAHASDCHPG